ncbi:MAG TPA: glycosyltransferase family 39 protein [Anaerolineales bacterium]|nr:glycosyltransferase family 39 protein [Anaerolineales bacterium]
MNPRLKKALLFLVLVALLAVPRLAGLDRFATIDEPYWLTAGSDFYYALGQRAFEKTVYDYHPAVTTMWIVAAAMLAYFPQYRGLGQGYFDVYKDTLERFLLSHGRTPLGLLTTGRVIQSLVIVFLLLVIFWFLQKLLGNAVAWTGTLLISFDPFFLGHSRLLNHEGMLSLFVMVSLLVLLTYHLADRRLLYVAVSGAAAGFAQLTKSSSIVLLPVIGLLFLLDWLIQKDVSWRRRLLVALRDIGIWASMLVLAYVAFWPGMWVAPGEMLYQVFGNAFSYAFEGSRLSVTGGVDTTPYQFNWHDLYAIVWGMEWRTTVVVWVGLVLGVLAAIRQGRTVRVVLVSLFVIGVAFVLLFGIASGRNSAHYMLTAYVALDIIAAAGYIYAANWLAQRFPRTGHWAVPAVASVAVLLQAASALPFFPYYYTYFNPVMAAGNPGGHTPNYGYGEGLELAADYLSKQPDAAGSTAVVFYGRGAFSYFYPGRTEQLKAVYADSENVPQLIDVLHGSRYVVLYYALEHQRNSPANVMQALESIQPLKSIWMNGIEYIRIYDVRDLPQAFYTALEQ